MPGLDGIGVLKAMRERGIAHPGHRADRAGRHRDRRLGDAQRRLRFRRQAGLARAAAHGDRQCAQGRGAGGATRSARRRGGGDARPSRTSSPAARRWSGCIRLAPEGGRLQHPDPDRGRIRRRQGTGRARHPGLAASGASKPFVTVNCGAIPDNLVESILFGHEKGSFTGATEKHAGKFVEAHRGTLFLDEIGDLPLDVQVKLLRAVQDGEVDPVGGALDRQGRHQADLGHPPRPAAAGQGRQVPRGSVLPPQRLSDLRAAAARPPRRHSASRRGISWRASRRPRRAQPHRRHLRQRARHARGL